MKRLNQFKPGELIPNKGVRVSTKVTEDQQPRSLLSGYDYIKRMAFHRPEDLQIDSMSKWKKKDFKGMKKKVYIKEVQKINDKILKIEEKSDLEKNEVYHDIFPFLTARRAINRFFIWCHLIAAAIIHSQAFENISITVIVVNSIVMAMEEPGAEQTSFMQIIDYVFTGLYTIEMILKIMGLGFILNRGSYLRDSFNILDFFIVITSYIPLLQLALQDNNQQINNEIGPKNEDSSSLGFTSLRTFRVLRPLKTISTIQGLKIIMQALFAAMPLLGDTLMILSFFFFVFSIAGSQLFTGLLKQRCIAIQSGKPHPDDLLCGTQLSCPGGYFCGKSNMNPNNGVSNFDTIFYSLLMVFQSVTLEGWSDLMVQMEQVFVPVVIYLFMIPLVFIGAFFLLNLTLAVINSSFNETHKRHQAAKDLHEEEEQIGDVEADMEKKLENINEMSIGQYITARVYARKMVMFLRMRQKIKQVERERTLLLKQRLEKQRHQLQTVKHKKPMAEIPSTTTFVPLITQSLQKDSRNQRGAVSLTQKYDANPGDISNDQIQLKNNNSVDANSLQHISRGSNSIDKKDIQNVDSADMANQDRQNQCKVIIEEDDREHHDEKSDKEQQQYLKSVQNLIKNGKTHLMLNGLQTKGISTPKRINNHQISTHTTPYTGIMRSNENNKGPGTQMMGNIGLTSKGVVIEKKAQNEIIDNLVKDLDIENVIGNYNNPITPTNKHQKIFKNSSQAKRTLQNGFQTNDHQDGIQTAAYYENDSENQNQNNSGLITSDSDFSEAVRQAGLHTPDLPRKIVRKNQLNFKQEHREDVSKTFKRMLTQNYKRGILVNYPTNSQNMHHGRSTEQQADSILSVSKLNPDFELTSLNSDIENKFARRRFLRQNLNQKQFQEDQLSMYSSHLQEKYLIPVKGNVYKKRQRSDYRVLQEVINTKRPDDPFEEVNPLTHKIVINNDAPYFGTSQQEIFLNRCTKQEVEAKLQQNLFIQLKQNLKESDDNEFDTYFIRSNYKPYQQKVEFEVLTDSSELNEDSSVSPDDDDRCAEEQPYLTPAQINYHKDLDHVHINEIAKRSDIVISSTLSFNMIPKDTRIISHIHKVNINKEDLLEYQDAKCSFKAMMKEYSYQSGLIRDKDKGFKDVYLKSFIHRQDFNTKTLKSFKERVKELNKNKVIVRPKDTQIEKMERLKHEQNKKAVEKLTQHGFPEYNLITIKQLLQGKGHEQFDDNEAQEAVLPTAQTIKNAEDDDGQSRLEKYLLQWTDFSKMDLRKKQEKEVFKFEDEIPDQLRKEFHIPQDMNYFDVNFRQIKKHDASKKRLQPIWSGQDILPLKLDHEKSLKIIQQINSIRVWPASTLSNMKKRFRYILRKIVKSGQFDSLMTLMVLLNSITLALERHGIQAEERQLLDDLDQWFTNIFIVEMASKIIAIGIQKYLMDRMNWLDGSVVLLSIFEMIYKAVQSGNINLQGFKTLRLFRTLRVFRVMRVLRALKSMQMIVSVMAKSYMSFIYITALMFLFIYIFALLCMTIFGATMNFPDGTPRSNYDGMLISVVTTFQVLTMENWQQILFNLMRSDQNNKFFVSLILMGWIFLGNFILLNLFLAILLDAFLEEEEEADLDQADQEKLNQLKIQKQIMKLNKKEKDKLKMRIQGQKKKEKSAMAKMLMGDENYESEDLEDMDEEQIIQIFKQQGIIKKSNDEQKEIRLYMGPPPIESQMSLYIFSKDNKIRQRAYKMIKHSAWDNTIILLIILSSIKLAFDTYFNDMPSDSIIVRASTVTDDIFNYAFIIELVVKVIAMGLFMDGGSYLRESWNQLDFFIVSSSIVDMTLQAMYDGNSIGFVKILRLLRVLRPLRMISRNPDLKLMVSALMESIGHILNVLVVIGIIYMIFSILGVNLFAGKFFYCSEDPLKLSTRLVCEEAGGQWMSQDHNFDDVVFGFNTLLVVASLEGWPDIMFNAADSVDIDQGPSINYSLPLASGFFLVYIMIGSFFLLNLFIGVLFVKFNQAKSENEKGLKPQDLAWMDIQRLILSQSPEYETTNVPKNPRRKRFHDLVTSRAFEITIMTCIVLNMLQMAMEYETSSEEYQTGLKYANYFFSSVFIIEATFKLIAFGKSYFENGWNKFDFFVVTASILDITMDMIGGTALQGIAFMPSLARVFRVLRVTRLFKLAGSLKGLQAIIQTIVFSIAQLSNVVLLLFIILFMFTVLAVEIFGNIQTGDVISEYKNFKNFHQSMLLLLAMMTGEDWNRVMFDCSRTPEDGCIEGENCGSAFAYSYFNVLIIVCSYVMLQLFILVIIQQFDKYYLSQDNTIKTFKDDLEKFYKIWKIFTQKRYRCYKIKENQLQMFFRELGGNNGENSLGFDREIPSQELKKHILKMGIKSNHGYVFFNELLYRCMRKKFGSMKLSRQMQIFELRTQYNIFLISQEVQQKLQDKAIEITKKGTTSSSQNIYNELIQKSGGFNPFLNEMNYKITFKTWLRYARQRLEADKKGNGSNSSHRKSFIGRMRKQMVKYIDVEIEIQNEVEWTSDEELDIISMNRSSKMISGTKRDKINKSKTIGQYQVSGNDVSEIAKHTHTKRSDHLINFEKKMLMKFKNMRTLKPQSQTTNQTPKKQLTLPNNEQFDTQDVKGGTYKKENTLKSQIGSSLLKKLESESKNNSSLKKPISDNSVRKSRTFKKQKIDVAKILQQKTTFQQ